MRAQSKVYINMSSMSATADGPMSATTDSPDILNLDSKGINRDRDIFVGLCLLLDPFGDPQQGGGEGQQRNGRKTVQGIADDCDRKKSSNMSATSTSTGPGASGILNLESKGIDEGDRVMG